MSRTAATWLTSVVMLSLLALSWRQKQEEVLLYGILLIAALVWDVYRYILTEQAMNIVRQVYLNEQFKRG